jgi:hypothetical protein
LHYRGLVFTIKDGGILSCLDAATGQPKKQERLDATGAYYSSPVAGDGKVYLLDEQGQLTVISAGKYSHSTPTLRDKQGKLTAINAQDDWQVLHAADFAEGGYATPAIVDGHIYLRTAGHLYCFGVDGP